MQDHTLENMTFEEYLSLKKEVLELYDVMMTMHTEKRRDSTYANARAAYMEKNNRLQQAREIHPHYENK